jgi:cob(I)alamin adenosyltransferase
MPPSKPGDLPEDRSAYFLRRTERCNSSSRQIEHPGQSRYCSCGRRVAHCEDENLRDRTKLIQSELFRIGSGLAAPPESRKPQVSVTDEMMEGLTTQVHEIEATPGLLSDWSLPGERPAGAAYDLGRTVCRRAERCEAGETVNPNILAYLNRYSDVLWLFARKIEVDAGVTNSLREMNEKSGPKWSRAW